MRILNKFYRCNTVLVEFLRNQKLKNNSDETIAYYKKRIGYFISFINNKKVWRLNKNDYNNYVLYLHNKNIADATIKTSLTAVRVFFNYLYNNGYINNDIVSELDTFKCGKKTIVILSKEQIKEIYSYYDEDSFYGARNLFLISLMFDCGLRVSEVLDLEKDDINTELKCMKVHGKGNKERIVPLSDVTLYYYYNYLKFPQIEIYGYFAVNIAGARLTSSAIRRFLIELRDKLGFTELYPHYLRHSFATWFLINGGDPLSLQIILGHSTLYMTENYVHIASEILIALKVQYSPLTNIPYFVKKRIPK